MSVFTDRAVLLSEDLPARITARVRQVVGLVIEGTGMSVPVGAFCRIHSKTTSVDSEVVGFLKGSTLLMPFGSLEGVAPGDEIECVSLRQVVPVGEQLLGRVIAIRRVSARTCSRWMVTWGQSVRSAKRSAHSMMTTAGSTKASSRASDSRS